VIWNVAAATLVAALLRFFRLGSQSLWIDEVFTWYSADIGRSLPWTHLIENVHGPLYCLILHAWGSLAGDSEWALRLPSAVFGTATVPAVAWLAARWLGLEVATPAAWLAAGSPFLVWYSQEARDYALLLPCVCLGAVAMLGLRDAISARSLAGYVAASVAGLLANFAYALLAPLHLLWWLGGRGDRRRRWIGLAVAVAALLVALSPWLPRLASVWDWRRLHPGGAHSSESLRGGPAISLAAYPFTLHAFAVGYTLGPSIRELRTSASAHALKAHAPELAVVLVLFGVLGVLVWRAAARRRVRTAALIAVLAPAMMVSYGAIQNFKVFHPRYVSVGFPFLLALTAAALADARPRLRAALAIALALVWGTSLAQHYFVPIYGKEDMRSAVEVIRAHARPGEKILAAGADDVLFYYYRGSLPVERYWLGWAADSTRMRARLDAARAGTRGVWVVWSRGEDLDRRGAFLHELETRFPRAETWRTEGVRVWHLPGVEPVAPRP
jgi:uncharacterized membrane protein